MGQGTAGKESELHISDDDGSTWVSVATTNIDPSFSVGEADTTEHGNAGSSRITTIFDAEIGVEMNYRPSADAGQQKLQDAFFAPGTDLKVRYFPLGSAGDGFEFGGHVPEYNPPSDATDRVSCSATIRQNDGQALQAGVTYAAPS